MTGEYTPIPLTAEHSLERDLESGDNKADKDGEDESEIPNPKLMSAAGVLLIVVLTGLLWYTDILRSVLVDIRTRGVELLYVIGILLLFIGYPLRKMEARTHSHVVPRVHKHLKREMLEEVRKLPVEMASLLRKLPNEILPKMRDEMEVVPAQVASKVMSGMGDVEKKFMAAIVESEERLMNRIKDMPKDVKDMMAAHFSDVTSSLGKHIKKK